MVAVLTEKTVPGKNLMMKKSERKKNHHGQTKRFFLGQTVKNLKLDENARTHEPPQVTPHITRAALHKKNTSTYTSLYTVLV